MKKQCCSQSCSPESLDDDLLVKDLKSALEAYQAFAEKNV